MTTEEGKSRGGSAGQAPPQSNYNGTFQGVANYQHPPPPPQPAIGFPQPMSPPGSHVNPQYYSHGYQTVPGNVGNNDGFTGARELMPEATNCPGSQAQHEEFERNARVGAVWQQMNKGVSTEKLNSIIKKPAASVKRTSSKTSSGTSSASWMTFLGLAPKRTDASLRSMPEIRPNDPECSLGDEAKRLAAAALSAVKDAATLTALSGRGKIEVTEVRDFAGEAIEVKKLVDANSKEASEKAKAPGGLPSAVDVVLEQIKKKPKLSVLDKTKKDWGEFKEDNKGMEEEMESYKKSGNQYLDKVSFLQRADYREFERERDARLALHSKRKSDISEDAS